MVARKRQGLCSSPPCAFRCPRHSHVSRPCSATVPVASCQHHVATPDDHMTTQGLQPRRQRGDALQGAQASTPLLKQARNSLFIAQTSPSVCAACDCTAVKNKHVAAAGTRKVGDISPDRAAWPCRTRSWKRLASPRRLRSRWPAPEVIPSLHRLLRDLAELTAQRDSMPLRPCGRC